MAMGIVSDEELQKELENSQVVPLKIGRGNNPQVPESLRKLIGENAIEEGSAATKEITRALGISDSSLSAYKHGATSTAKYHEPDPALQSHVNQARQRIVKKARNRLVQSLNEITPEKLSQEKPRDLAAIAKDMSAIVRDFEPRDDNEKAPRAFVVYAPTVINENKFETLQVQE